MEMTFDKARLKRLIEAYDRAIDEDQDNFWFEDAHFHTPYAKYFIEYLTSMLTVRRKKDDSDRNDNT